jgi:hypothetical protein
VKITYRLGERKRYKEIMATAKVGLSFTKNLGNFENIRLHVEVEENVKPDEDSGAAVDRVYELVDAKMNEKLAEINKDAAARE